MSKPWFAVASEENVKALQEGREPPHKCKNTAWSTAKFSQSLSVHPSQAAEFNAAAKAAGNAGVYYDKKGNCHFDSRGARKRECKRRGCIDQDGGYGDAT